MTENSEVRGMEYAGKQQSSRTDIGTVYSNFDHVLDEEIAKRLSEEPDTYGTHAAYNYCAYVWFDDGRWYECVWRYGAPIELLNAESIKDVIRETVETWGDE